MELKSKYFNASMGKLCKDIPTEAMIEMITELVSSACFDMNTTMDTPVTVRTVQSIIDKLKHTKFNTLTFCLVVEGFSRGSMRDLGGTTKFSVSNFSAWMNAMLEKQAQIAAEQKTKEDLRKKEEEARAYKNYRKGGSDLFAIAVSKKHDWYASKLISSEDYDRPDLLDNIVALLQQGYNYGEIQPKMVL